MAKHKSGNPLKPTHQFNPLTRHEEVRFDFVEKPYQDLTVEQKNLLKKIGSKIPDWLIKDDGYHLHYTIAIDYLNNIDKRLMYVEQLIDKGFVIEAISKTLNNTRCLIQDIFAKIERIEGKYIQSLPKLSNSEIRKSKAHAEKRLKEDTERAGYRRGSLFQHPNGKWSIDWDLGPLG